MAQLQSVHMTERLHCACMAKHYELEICRKVHSKKKCSVTRTREQDISLVECLKHLCTLFWSHLKCVVSEGLSTQPSRVWKFLCSNFMNKKIKKIWEKNTFLYTCKGSEHRSFQIFSSRTQIIIGLMTRASNLDKSILKPSLVWNGYKGGNITLYSFDYMKMSNIM